MINYNLHVLRKKLKTGITYEEIIFLTSIPSFLFPVWCILLMEIVYLYLKQNEKPKIKRIWMYFWRYLIKTKTVRLYTWTGYFFALLIYFYLDEFKLILIYWYKLQI